MRTGVEKAADREWFEGKPKCPGCGRTMDYVAELCCSPCEKLVDRGLSLRAIRSMRDDERRRALQNASQSKGNA